MAWSCWELWGYVWLNSSLTPFCIYAGWFLNVMYYSKNQAEQFVFFLRLLICMVLQCFYRC